LFNKRNIFIFGSIEEIKAYSFGMIKSEQIMTEFPFLGGFFNCVFKVCQVGTEGFIHETNV